MKRSCFVIHTPINSCTALSTSYRLRAPTLFLSLSSWPPAYLERCFSQWKANAESQSQSAAASQSQLINTRFQNKKKLHKTEKKKPHKYGIRCLNFVLSKTWICNWQDIDTSYFIFLNCWPGQAIEKSIAYHKKQETIQFWFAVCLTLILIDCPNSYKLMTCCLGCGFLVEFSTGQTT